MNNTRGKINFVIYIASAVAAAVTLKYSFLVQSAVKEALVMCAQNIIPSLFVFSSVSLVLISSPYSDNIFTRKLSSLLGFRGNCGVCVFFGLLAGFPTAAVGAADLLEKGEITKRDCEKIVCFANNAGFAFLVGSVGGMFADVSYAKILCICQTAASVTMLTVFREKRRKNKSDRKEHFISEQIKFTEAISRAAYSMLRVTAFVCFFTVVRILVMDAVSAFSDSETLHAVISAFIELGNAAKVCAGLTEHGKIICAFAVGFGGISAIIQSISACPEVKMSKYFAARLAMGALCTVYFALTTHLLNNFS